MRFPRRFGVVLIAALIILPSSLGAQEFGAGCRAPTDAEKLEMTARGLPISFQICPADMKLLGIGQDFDQWYAQLKTQSPCNQNSCKLSCRTRNTGAQVCGKTSRKWGSIGCHPNNQTAIFPTASHGFAAHIELLQRYCGERGRCTIGRVIEQWTATVGDRPSYASFVSRNSGMPVNKVFDPNDIDLMGRIALSMSCFESGSMPYPAAELKKGLIMAGGGARVPTPPNVGQLLQESLVGNYEQNYAGSPNSHPGSWAYPSQTLGTSVYSPPQPPANPLPILNTPPDTGIGDTEGTGNTGTNPTTGSDAWPALAATLVAQPTTVRPGASVLVSWSTASADGYSCTVTTGGSSIGSGKAGSVRSETNSGDLGTSRTYTLECTKSGSATVIREANVNVRL
jgi:hypothetical protein